MDPTKENAFSGCGMTYPFFEGINLRGMCSSVINGITYLVVDVAMPPVRRNLWEMGMRLNCLLLSQPISPAQESPELRLELPRAAATQEQESLPPAAAASKELVVWEKVSVNGCLNNEFFNSVGEWVAGGGNPNFYLSPGSEKSISTLKAVQSGMSCGSSCSCRVNSVNMAKFLLESKADPNYRRTPYSQAPLQTALNFGLVDYTALLINHRANVDLGIVRDFSMINIFNRRVDLKYYGNGLTELRELKLLIESKVDIDNTCEFSNPDGSSYQISLCCEAINAGRIEVAQLLFDCGATLPPGFQTISSLPAPCANPNHERTVADLRRSIDDATGNQITEVHLITMIMQYLLLAVPPAPPKNGTQQ